MYLLLYTRLLVWSWKGKHIISCYWDQELVVFIKYALHWMHAQSCLTLCNPMDCNPLGSSVHGIFQARRLEWVAISFSSLLNINFSFEKGLCYLKERPLFSSLLFPPKKSHSQIFKKRTGEKGIDLCTNPLGMGIWPGYHHPWASQHSWLFGLGLGWRSVVKWLPSFCRIWAVTAWPACWSLTRWGPLFQAQVMGRCD